MAAKFFIFTFASLALFNTIAVLACGPSCAPSWPCGGPAVAPAWSSLPATAIGGYGLGAGCNAVAVDNGGALTVTSASALAPTGITIVSTNEINGILDVVGAAPLLAAVAFESNLPTAGAAGTSYGCGNGNIGITAESLAAAGIGAGSGLAGYGLGATYGNAGLANALGGVNAGRLIAPGAGCGCGGIYY